MAIREVRGTSRTSRFGHGKICSSRRSTRHIRASMAAARTMTVRAAMPAPTTQSIWMRNSFSDTHLCQRSTLKEKQFNEEQSIGTGGTDRRVVQRGVGG